MKKRILSFDGGGIRGVVSAIFLEELEKSLGKSIVDQVDLFAGTSTGSIFAGALAAGLSPSQIIEFYMEKSETIFTSHFSIDHLLHIKSKYSNKPLQDAITSSFSSQGIDPKLKLKDLKKKIVIPTINLEDQKLRRWRLEPLDNLSSTNEDLLLIDAIMRSTAAPTYFPSYQGCIDGGMGANDPSILAYSAYLSSFKKHVDISLLSIGTGFTNHFVEKGENWGAFSWIFDLHPHHATKSPLLSLLFDVQEQLSSQLSSMLLKDSFYKLDLKLDQAVSLNDTSQIPALIKKTKETIKAHPKQWEESCLWTEKHFF